MFDLSGADNPARTLAYTLVYGISIVVHQRMSEASELDNYAETFTGGLFLLQFLDPALQSFQLQIHRP